MKKIITYLSQFEENYPSKTGEDYESMFVSRQILIVQMAFWLGGGIHLFYTFKAYLSDPTQIPYNALTLFFGCFPSYYFLQKKKLNYAFFFAYYPVMIFHMLASFQEAHTNLNGELAFIAYAAFPIVCFKAPHNIIGFLLNYVFFVTIKIIKYPLHTISSTEFYNEILIVTCIYITIFMITYFYKIDYIVLRKTNKELDFRKLIIEEQSKELQQINSTKNRLFSIIAHDVRYPLSSIKGVMELFDSESISKQEFKELSKRLQQNVDNVHGMLDNLLLWSLSQMEGIKPKRAPFDLNFIIDESLLIFKESATQKQINLTDYSATNLLALGDEYQIKTVLRNLINNAIKFTPLQGNIAIHSSIKEQFIHLKITDSGLGIEKNDLTQIFLNPKLKTGTAGEKGTGFGLFLCKELIEKNGGTIQINSEIGRGTTVDLLLPAVEYQS
jgi:hypothetical protein